MPSRDAAITGLGWFHQVVSAAGQAIRIIAGVAPRRTTAILIRTGGDGFGSAPDVAPGGHGTSPGRAGPRRGTIRWTRQGHAGRVTGLPGELHDTVAAGGRTVGVDPGVGTRRTTTVAISNGGGGHEHAVRAAGGGVDQDVVRARYPVRAAPRTRSGARGYGRVAGFSRLYLTVAAGGGAVGIVGGGAPGRAAAVGDRRTARHRHRHAGRRAIGGRAPHDEAGTGGRR
jgi:hypothetical protein